MKARVGDDVGAQRWPFHANHPSNWGVPHRGVLLDRKDPRAWANTAAFPTPTPDADAVARWVDRVEREFGSTTVPVLWDFGDRQVVYWERPERVVPYADDIHHWSLERNRALARFTEKKRYAPAIGQRAAAAA